MTSLSSDSSLEVGGHPPLRIRYGSSYGLKKKKSFSEKLKSFVLGGSGEEYVPPMPTYSGTSMGGMEDTGNKHKVAKRLLFKIS